MCTVVVVKSEIYTRVMSSIDPASAGRESFVYTVRPSEHSPLEMLALKRPSPPDAGEVTFTVMLHWVLTFRLGHAVCPWLTSVTKTYSE